MPTYTIDDKTLIMKPKKVPVWVKAILYCVTVFSVIFSFTILIFGILTNGFLFFSFIIIFIFCLLVIYFVRLSLWNTFGREVIHFSQNQVTYQADYGWFKGSQHNIHHDNQLEITIQQVDYEDDNIGVLIFYNKTDKIESVVKMPISTLEKLINELYILIDEQKNSSLKT